MSALKKHRHGIYCLDANYIKGQLAAIYIIVDANEVAIIETATSHSVPLLLKALEQLGLTPEHIKYIIPTHIHLDHAGGCGALLKRCQHATVLVHPRGIRHLINPAKLIAGAKTVYGEDKFNKLYGEIEAIDARKIKQQAHLSSVTLGQRELLFLHTEGHAKHHFCVFDKTSKAMFTGDTFGISYPLLNRLCTHQKCAIIPTTTPIHFDPKAMLASLKLILSYQPSILFLTHFNAITDIQSAYQQLVFWVEHYEHLVQSALKNNSGTLDYFYQQLLHSTQDYLAENHGLTPFDVETHLAYDLELNAQGLLHYSQTLEGI